MYIPQTLIPREGYMEKIKPFMRKNIDRAKTCGKGYTVRIGYIGIQTYSIRDFLTGVK